MHLPALSSIERFNRMDSLCMKSPSTVVTGSCPVECWKQTFDANIQCDLYHECIQRKRQASVPLEVP